MDKISRAFGEHLYATNNWDVVHVEAIQGKKSPPAFVILTPPHPAAAELRAHYNKSEEQQAQ